MQKLPARFVVVSSRQWGRHVYDRLPESLRQETAFLGSGEFEIETIEKIRPEYIFILHWSSRIEKEIYDAFDCIIFHMTDLPYGRGGSPLQNLILRGHKETMVSALKCVEELDAGPVYLKSPLSLEGTAGEVFERLVPIAARMIEEIALQKPVPQPQQGQPTFFKRRKPEDGTLANVSSLAEAYDIIRMLDAEGYPSAFLDAGELRLEFSGAEFDGEHLTAKVILKERRRSECK